MQGRNIQMTFRRLPETWELGAHINIIKRHTV